MLQNSIGDKRVQNLIKDLRELLIKGGIHLHKYRKTDLKIRK
jgi:hypothetical protein